MKQSPCSPAAGIPASHLQSVHDGAMTGDDQREVIAYLSTPEAYGLRDEPIERIDTHISVVWLAGDRAYKLKRAVRYDYVDFSSIAARRTACEAEVRLNRRTAPSLYLGVRPVTRESGGALAIGGLGKPIDWLVEMRRFDQSTLFDRLAEQGRLDPGRTEGVADAVARLHAQAEPRRDHGGRDGMAWVIDGNEAGLAEQGTAILDAPSCERLSADARAMLERQAARLDARRRDGLVRECHGDLHLRNICLVGGVPTLFDAVEFNDNISCIDVFYDIAFLLMDLWRRGLRSHANRVFNQYLPQTSDLNALPLLPLFLSCRAAVRAKTTATAAKVQRDAEQRSQLEIASRDYLALASALLRPPPACLIAIGGFSGSGKTTLARRLAPVLGPAPGALIVRSDLIRKTLLGVPALARLGPDGYSDSVTQLVYRTIGEHALDGLRAGHAVIADAVFARPTDRDAIATIAREAGVSFVGLWIDGSADILAARLRERRADASDATPDVLAAQMRAGTGAIDPSWQHLEGTQGQEQVERVGRAIVTRSAPLSVQ